MIIVAFYLIILIFFFHLLSHLNLSLPFFLFPLSSPTLFRFHVLLNLARKSIQIIKFFKLILNLDPKLIEHIWIITQIAKEEEEE